MERVCQQNDSLVRGYIRAGIPRQVSEGLVVPARSLDPAEGPGSAFELAGPEGRTGLPVAAGAG